MFLRQIPRRRLLIAKMLLATCCLAAFGFAVASIRIDRTPILEISDEQYVRFKNASTTSELYKALDGVSPGWHSLSIAFPYADMFTLWWRIDCVWTRYLQSRTLANDVGGLLIFLSADGELHPIYAPIDIDPVSQRREGLFRRADRRLRVRIDGERRVLFIEEQK
ncbi:MAG: hypothetical protein JNJ88_01755 [Planctomycetes bacterium]|nr:hypothetical protein [Planctomycetota bacterium]